MQNCDIICYIDQQISVLQTGLENTRKMLNCYDILFYKTRGILSNCRCLLNFSVLDSKLLDFRNILENFIIPVWIDSLML